MSNEEMQAEVATLRAEVDALKRRLGADTSDAGGMLTTTQVMRRMSFGSRGRFLAAAKRANIYCVKVNARKFAWPEAAIEAWIARCGVGKIGRPAIFSR